LLSRLSRVYQHIIGKSAHFRGRFLFFARYLEA